MIIYFALVIIKMYKSCTIISNLLSSNVCFFYLLTLTFSKERDLHVLLRNVLRDVAEHGILFGTDRDVLQTDIVDGHLGL